MTLPLVALALVVMGAALLAIYGIREQREKPKRVHLAPAFGTYASEVGRVAEEGATIHIVLGGSSLLQEQGLTAIAALQGMTSLAQLAAAYDTPPYVTTSDPTILLVAENKLQDAYARLGNLRSYQPGMARYLAPDPMLFAAMAAALSSDESVGTDIALGPFEQEVSLVSNAALNRGTKLLGGATSAAGVAALYPDIAGDQLVIGERVFAGGAEVSDRSAFWASLSVEDVLRWLVVLGIVLAAGASLLGLGG